LNIDVSKRKEKEEGVKTQEQEEREVLRMI
jgi:hypothetical protein